MGNFTWQKIRTFFSAKNTDANYLKAILDTTIDAIITIDQHKKIEIFNKTAEHVFGFTKEEVVGKDISVLALDNIPTAGMNIETTAKRKNSSTFSIDIAASKVDTTKQLFTIRDITLRKESETLKLQNIRMETEANAKNEYVSILGHELRTPLTSIQGSLGLLLDEKELSAKEKELLSIAYRNAERLGNIIRDVIDIGRLQAGKLKIELNPISLVPLVKEAIAVWRLIANTKGVILVDTIPEIEIIVLVNYDRLIQVCLNMLSNAVKFSHPGQTITISMQPSENNVRISVEDEGIGISEAFRPRLFTAFSQADYGNTKIEGVGLGLHISKRIVEQFGGIIGYVSKKERGTVFYFDLPIYRAIS